MENTSLIHIHAGHCESALHEDVDCHPQWKGANDESREAMTEINSRLEDVLEKAPSDSTANLLLRKTSDGYRAFFKVRSAQSNFVGFIRGSSLLEVVDSVIGDVRSQIDQWKLSRRMADEPS